MNLRFVYSLIAIIAIQTFTACNSTPAIIKFEMKEFSFNPDTITISAGSQVMLELSNTGALEHDMVIMVDGTEATIPFDEDDTENTYWNVSLNPGEKEIITFTAPSMPGVYQIVCSIPGHLQQGMKATLIVEEK